MSSEDIPELIDAEDVNSHDENAQNGDDEGEEEIVEFITEPCKDLFSGKIFKTAVECLNYCKDVHGFDVKVLRRRFGMDCFSFIKLVNYIRSEKPSPGLVMSLSSDNLWSDDLYMKPVVEDDPLLMVDIEEDEDGDDSFYDNTETCDNIVELRRELAEMKAKAELLAKSLVDVESMRALTQKLIADDDNSIENQKNDVASLIKSSEDGAYAGSYAHFSIHHEMLSDRIRTEAYRDAMYNNKAQIEGKQVLDLGCGTGILSMFAAKSGANKVVGVDMSDIIHNTIDIVRENGLQDHITLVKGRLEDVDLAAKGVSGKFDVLVSEWMGYFLLYEGMLDSVVAARDKYLKPGGLILPNICSLHLVAVSDEERYAKTIEFWKDVYGFKMSCLKDPVMTEASIEVVSADKVVSNPCEILNLDLSACRVDEFAKFESDFELEIVKTCELTCIAGYFDAVFGQMKCDPVKFTTGPHGTPTHWKQTIFYLKKKLPVVAGKSVKGRIRVFRPPKDARSLSVMISMDGCDDHLYEMA